MKKVLSVIGIAVALLVTSVAPANAGSVCNNGSYSANSGRGTCSKNGGVNKNYQSYSDPGSSSYNRKNNLNGFGNSSKNGGFSSLNNGYGTTTKRSTNSGIGSGMYGLSKKCPAFTVC